MQSPLKFKEKIGYGLGDFASSMFWKMFSVYLLYFYTDVFGITAALAGTMFLLTRIWDAANDPIMGIIADRTNSRFGKFRPYLLFAAIPFGIVGVLTFTVPDLTLEGKTWYAYISYTLMMMVYTIVNVPYASLMGVMTSNLKDRTTLSTHRFICAFAGSLLVLAATEPLVEYFNESKVINQGWQMVMIIYAIIAAGLFFITFLWTKERIQPPINQRNSIKLDLKGLMNNKPWLVLSFAGTCMLIFNSIRDGSVIYYFKYLFDSNEAFVIGSLDISMTYSALYLILGQAANIVGVLLAKPISERIGKKYTFLFSMLIAGLLSILFFFLDQKDIYILFVLQFFISVCAGIIFPLLWSMYADIADYSEWKTNRRATGLIFSSSSMAQKLGWTLGGAITGWILFYFGFEANMEQTEQTKTGIKMMMSILPASGAFLSVLIISFYYLNDPLMEKVNKDLEKRRYVLNNEKTV